MSKYYAVCSSVYDDGTVVVNLVETIEADTKPKNTFNTLNSRDVYIDWFDSLEKAKNFINTSRNV